MKIDYFHVSAFTNVPGQGNPAGVCWLPAWPADEELVRIAKAIGLPVTACIVPAANGFELRWLSRAGLFVKSMCGHGTLAAAFTVSIRHPSLTSFTFRSPGGEVPVERRGETFFLALPKWSAKPTDSYPELATALGAKPEEVLDAGRDLMAVYSNEAEVRSLRPDMAKLLSMGHRGFIATARGTSLDCVSRFFCPSFGLGVDEDAVTGSAHCAIAPYWARKLGKNVLSAHQASSAGGDLTCEVTETSVVIGSQAALLRKASVSIYPGCQ